MKIEQETKTKYLNNLIIDVVFTTIHFLILAYIVYIVEITWFRIVIILITILCCTLSITKIKKNYHKIINF